MPHDHHRPWPPFAKARKKSISDYNNPACISWLYRATGSISGQARDKSYEWATNPATWEFAEHTKRHSCSTTVLYGQLMVFVRDGAFFNPYPFNDHANFLAVDNGESTRPRKRMRLSLTREEHYTSKTLTSSQVFSTYQPTPDPPGESIGSYRLFL
ncbi:hypothetical protein K469DRAFT_399319 [Zopfia rhizophila CBS 207.26]|uniref:Uncharacterized protein n=1 Tax=Zopfia rhizophila CBS 207.26 TaxID=1314779 RepID=A0A6A6DDT4_9PEZI|nr:hypothetical protein K469DRAFT_399319 [Zopfia rhizophila CBS 207.26]